MPKAPTLSPVAGTRSKTIIDSNFDEIASAFQNTLSLNGATPNAMQNDLDMGGYSIINVGQIEYNTIISASQDLTDRSTLRLSTMLPTVKEVYLNFYDANYPDFNSGHRVKRMSLADITAAGYPASAYVKSLDRFMPDGTTDAVNGGYWVVAEEAPGVTAFGAIPDGNFDGTNLPTGTDNLQAFNDWKDFYLAKYTVTGNERTSGPFMRVGAGVFYIDFGSNGGLNFVAKSSRWRNWGIDFRGSTILAEGNNAICFDFTDSEYWTLVHPHIIGTQNASTMPRCAIKTGRIGDSDTAARWTIIQGTTRSSTAAKSCFKTAALWVVASEESAEFRCRWDNQNDVNNLGASYAAIYDGSNYIAYHSGFTITLLPIGANPTITAPGHDFVNDDYVLAGSMSGGAGSVVDAVEGKLFQVKNVSGDTFNLWDLSTGDYLDTSGLTALGAVSTFGGSFNKIHKRRFIDCVDSTITLRPTPYKQNSMKHYNRYNCVYSCPDARGAVFYSCSDPSNFDNCYLVGQIGIDIYGASHEQTQFLNNTCFNIHHESGSNPNPPQYTFYFTTVDAALHVDTSGPTDISPLVIGCEFTTARSGSELQFIRIDPTVFNAPVKFIDCKFAVPRVSVDYNLFVNSQSLLEILNSTVVLHDLVGTENIVSTGTQWTELGANARTVPITPVSGVRQAVYTVATVPSADKYKGMSVLVTDTSKVPALQRCYSNGTTWRFEIDGTVLS